ncbi:protein of unknown function [Chryseobacterium arachidis]|uniref:Putative auto-transporter adhesin head GIN domain-containing protein n=1 Tax=Chryseobacterium arachidis TaxID=1416778 RepID=A0A1M5INZ9_9FLAO|nr:DUF4252 domain-containing protein [Chryseobacterium arachidis]SHG29966.1 protein of unknown function [Chryseobacterium arachidis]
MKNILSILFLFLNSLVTFSAQTEKLDKLFQSFENKGGVTSIDIKKPMFNLLDKIDISSEYLNKIQPIMKQVDGFKVLIVSKATFPDNLKSENLGIIEMNQKKTDWVNHSLSQLNFNELMSLKSNDVSMKFLAESEKNNILENLVFNIDSKEENVIFILNGKMKMEDVNRIISSAESKTNTVTVNKIASSFTSSKTNSYVNGEFRNVGNFSGIHVSTGLVVNFTQENPTSVRVVADADKLQYIVTKVEDGVLKVYVDNKGQKNLKFKNININVSSPKINTIKTSSGAIFNAVENIRENNLTVDVSSGSVVNGSFTVSEKANVELSSGAVINSEINTKDINIKGSSGSAANLSGKANWGAVDVSSGAVCNAEGLKFNVLDAESTSGAVVSGHAVEELKAKASSGGIIRYRGNPKIESNISKISGGALKQID